MTLTDGNGRINRNLSLGDTVHICGSSGAVTGGDYTVRRIWGGQYTRTVALLSEERRDVSNRPYRHLALHDGPFALASICIADDSDEAIDAGLNTISRHERAWASFGRGAADAQSYAQM